MLFISFPPRPFFFPQPDHSLRHQRRSEDCRPRRRRPPIHHRARLRAAHGRLPRVEVFHGLQFAPLLAKSSLARPGLPLARLGQPLPRFLPSSLRPRGAQRQVSWTTTICLAETGDRKKVPQPQEFTPRLRYQCSSTFWFSHLI
jgi:hypothetical protein